jgi:hypothetical protein
MARNHARILTSIWASEFTECSPRAQWLYMLLLSQPDLTPCGALAYVPGRWARLAPGMKVEDVEKAATELEERSYVVIDRDTAELVIRTLVVHDGGLNNSKMRGAVRSALGAIHSPRLREAIIGVLPVDIRNEIAPGSTRDRPPIDDKEPIDDRSEPDPENAEVGGRRDRSSTSSLSGSGGGRAKRGTRIPDDFELTAERERWAHERCRGVDVVHHTERFVNFWRAKPGREACKLDWERTWKNWMLEEFSKLGNGARAPTASEPKRCPDCANTGHVFVDGELVECSHGRARV